MTNPPTALEWAIDKYTTLDIARQNGLPVPETVVVQNRSQAMEAFNRLGGDCVVKPIYGGEGRGVMRIENAELMWTVASTLQTNGSVIYIQRFVPPGGRDIRVLIVGPIAHAIRRENASDFRTNQTDNRARGEVIDHAEAPIAESRKLCEAMGLKFAAVDWLLDEQETPVLVEINAIPGWRAAQRVVRSSIASDLLAALLAA